MKQRQGEAKEDTFFHPLSFILHPQLFILRPSSFILRGTMDDRVLPPRSFALTAATFEGALVPVAVGLGWLLNQPPLETLRWDPVGLMLGPLLALPPLALVLVCIRWPVWPFADIRRVVEQMLVPLFRQWTVAEMAIIALLAGLGEEVLFRGFLQAAITQWTASNAASVGWHSPALPAWMAVVVVGAVFGMAHGITLGYALLAGVIGLYIGWLWMLTGSLIIPITIHAVYDFLALLYLVKLKGSAGEAGGGESANQEKFNQ
jgi:hypothetical protein